MKQPKQKVYDYLAFWGTCAVYLFAFLFIVSAYTPLKIFRSKYVSTYVLAILYQVRWDVYVKAPWEPTYEIYTLPGNKPEYMDLRPFQSKYYYGLNRDYKIIFSEINIIYTDTPALTKMKKYPVTIPAGGNLKDYISADTLQYNTISYRNILYLKGKYLLAIGPPMNWEYDRKNVGKPKTYQIVPLNIEAPHGKNN